MWEKLYILREYKIIFNKLLTCLIDWSCYFSVILCNYTIDNAYLLSRLGFSFVKRVSDRIFGRSSVMLVTVFVSSSSSNKNVKTV